MMLPSFKLLAAAQRLASAIAADYASVQRNREKYHGEKVSKLRMPVDFLRKVGFQQACALRVMRFGKEAGIVGLAPLTSRLLRHLYGLEVHWDAKIAPGISIVHGTGLVISHAATVGPGCILFHNVTLGEGLDPKTKARGAPTLEANVHVGPGAIVLGPITVGAGSKVAAGAVLTQSVPANSVVMPAPAQIKARAARKGEGAAALVAGDETS